MREGTRQNHISTLAALLLLAAFAASILLVLLAGAGAYRRLVDRDEADFQSRTAAQYIATRVRQNDAAQAVSVTDFQGTRCLALTEEGGEYATWLYCYDGSLWELYTATDLEAGLEDGDRVLDLAGMDLEMEGGLLEAVLTFKDGTAETVKLSLRGGEVAP